MGQYYVGTLNVDLINQGCMFFVGQIVAFLNREALNQMECVLLGGIAQETRI